MGVLVRARVCVFVCMPVCVCVCVCVCVFARAHVQCLYDGGGGRWRLNTPSVRVVTSICTG